mmetsp:Transcript_23595/g.50336  ORF Transcript_23595/g.50336 Transcript_23595/m.50336 type:complete len:378 (-) Transcript_23595:349-1482(-)
MNSSSASQAGGTGIESASEAQRSRQGRLLEEEVERLLLGHRRAFEASRLLEDERKRARREQAPKKPFEVLEVAYQAALQIMMALLVPRVHPVVSRLSQLIWRRDYPRELALPSLSVFVSGLHAKLALDVANLVEFVPFRWVQPRPARHELLHPLSPRGVELNLVGSLVGVCTGRILVASREGLRAALEFIVGTRLPPLLAQLLAGSWHMTASCILAPIVVNNLASSLRTAQLRRSLLLPMLIRRAERVATSSWQQLGYPPFGPGIGSRFLPWIQSLEPCAEVPYWEGVEEDDVPQDLLCPITGSVFVKPVVLRGMIFEEHAVRRWVVTTGRHPVLQGVYCHEVDLDPALDLEALCRRLAEERGWTLRYMKVADLDSC